MTNNKLIRKSLPYIIGIIIFLILSMVADSQIAKNQDSERLKAAGRYSAFQYELTSILDREVTLMKGIITLLSFKKMQISDEEIYGYIDSLITEQQKLIRNISILEDTTIRWAYPVETEQGAIGIDLATVEGQKRGVLTVKEERRSYFQGPVNLVQGGQGYIIRLPILQEDQSYWGQLSLVIDREEYVDQIRRIAMKNDIRVHIVSKLDRSIVYEDLTVLEEKPLVFELETDRMYLDIYVVPMKGWNDNTLTLLAGFIISLLVSVAIGVGIWYNLEAIKKLEKMANRDFLTGMYNRHFFDEYISIVIGEARRTKEDIGFVIIDLNNFKAINDTYGHLIGDEVLKRTARVLNEHCRSKDVVFRIGGDEFLIILPNISSDKVIKEFIKRIDASFEDEFMFGQQSIQISPAIGYGLYPEDGVDVDAVTRAADERMYTNKSEYKQEARKGLE
jgi:diguanylate cyclase (GGDEF)-like protein